MINASSPHVDTIDGIAFAQRQIEIAVPVKGNRARAAQRRTLQRCAIRRGLLFPGACPGVDDSCLQIQPPNAEIADVADQQGAIRRERDAVRLPELRLGRRTAIAAEAGFAGACHGGNNPGFAIHPPHYMIQPLDEEHISGAIEADLIWFIQRCLSRGTAIARVSLVSISGYGRAYTRLQIQPAHAMIIDLTKIKRAIRPDRKTVGIVDASIRIARLARPEQCCHLLTVRAERHQQHGATADREPHSKPPPLRFVPSYPPEWSALPVHAAPSAWLWLDRTMLPPVCLPRPPDE